MVVKAGVGLSSLLSDKAGAGIVIIVIVCDGGLDRVGAGCDGCHHHVAGAGMIVAVVCLHLAARPAVAVLPLSALLPCGLLIIVIMYL